MLNTVAYDIIVDDAMKGTFAIINWSFSNSFNIMNGMIHENPSPLSSLFMAAVLLCSGLSEWSIGCTTESRYSRKNWLTCCCLLRGGGSHISCYLLYTIKLCTNTNPKVVNTSTMFGTPYSVGIGDRGSLQYSQHVHSAPWAFPLDWRCEIFKKIIIIIIIIRAKF